MKPGDKPNPDELLAAYVDGVGELTTEERRRVDAQLADDPAWRSEAEATRELLGTLRALPEEGVDPDWAAMEHAIREEVGDTVPTSWWRAWRWLIPVGTLALSGAVLALVLRTPATVPPSHGLAHDAGVAAVAPAAVPKTSETVPLWLDGAEIDVDLQAAELLEQNDDPLGSVDGGAGLLPSSDLAWVDDLGDDDMAAAEAWLARTKS